MRFITSLVTTMKIYFMGRRMNGRFDSFKMKVRRAIRFMWNMAILGGVGYGVFMLGAYTFSTSTTEAQMIRVQMPVISPVLDRIADCESGNGTTGSSMQFKNGQVLVKGNKNGSVDMGRYQVNSIWFKKAAELGFDLSTEEGNKNMAEWIYLNRGTGDWSASVKCWQK